MPGKKISELTELTTTPESGDYLLVVDTSANETKKLDYANFVTSVSADDASLIIAAQVFG